MLKTWDGIKSMININKKEKKDINFLKVDDQQATDPFVISNLTRSLPQQLKNRKQNCVNR